MLERVGIGQARFNVPGLVADGRGVVVGRLVVLRFSALGRLVSFLRLWSGEQALDDLHPGLRLMHARTIAGTREALVSIPVTSLPLVDAMARAARTVGGQCFTGAGKHFVQYRDQRGPLGYDVDRLEIVAEGADFILYEKEHTHVYTVSGELALDKLLFRLDLQRQHAGPPVSRDVLYLSVRRGLGPLVIEYLYRAQRSTPALRASAALVEPQTATTFRKDTSSWLFRLEDLPNRLLAVLGGTPGLTLFAPVAENVALAVGYRHPVHLGSCKQVFPAGRLFLFSPGPAGVTTINPTPTFSPVADLVRLEPLEPAAPGEWLWDSRPPEVEAAPAISRSAGRLEFVVPLRLEPGPTGAGRAIATIVPWQRLGWLRSLCYALPPSALRGYRLAALERGLLVVAPHALAGFPFGQLLYAPTSGLLVPLGWELRPLVSPDELASRVGATGGAIVVFPGPGERPFRIPAASIESLEARALTDSSLGGVHVESAIRPPFVEEPVEVEIENQSLGPMPLWRLGSDS